MSSECVVLSMIAWIFPFLSNIVSLITIIRYCKKNNLIRYWHILHWSEIALGTIMNYYCIILFFYLISWIQLNDPNLFILSVSSNTEIFYNDLQLRKVRLLSTIAYKIILCHIVNPPEWPSLVHIIRNRDTLRLHLELR